MTTLLSMILSSILLMYVSMGLATVTSSQLNANDASKIAIQTLQYADIKANELRAVSYNTLDSKAEAKATISGTRFLREVTIGPETDLGGGAKQRIATVNIYRNGETLPRQAISVPLSSQGSGDSTLHGKQLFTAVGTTTWTVPTGISQVWVSLSGGGGNGNNSGAGGGAAAKIAYNVTGLTSGSIIPITVGGISGTSSFGGYVSCAGGGAGHGWLPNAGGAGGSNGSGWGDYSGLSTGTGGSSIFGSGGGYTASIGGINGSGYGAGGGAGMLNMDGNDYPGGAGTPGMVLVEW